MILALRKDRTEKVTPEEIEKRNNIVDKINKRKYALKGEADFLLKYDKKTRCCSECGRTFDKKPLVGWWEATAPDRYGNEIPVGLHAKCFDCELKQIIIEGYTGKLGLNPLSEDDFSRIKITKKDGK